MEKKQEIENENYKDIKRWIFAEWISIMTTFVVCFVFLFYQNQVQSARSDELYAMYGNVLKEIKDIYKERK